MKKCPYCGRDNDDKAVICEKCYAEIPAEKQKTEPEKVQKQGVKKNGT
jgi:uncharacterized membrane protein YvbJ